LVSSVSFGSWNKPLEWNDYSIEIVIHLFDRGLFLGLIVIPIEIIIPLRRGIPIPLKNERNNYSNRNRLHFQEKTTFIFIFYQYLFFFKKDKKKKPQLPLQWLAEHPNG
jgi:hypothetical protein